MREDEGEREGRKEGRGRGLNLLGPLRNRPTTPGGRYTQEI